MKLQELEFIAGPLDGLKHGFRHSSERFPSEIGLPVNASLVRFLSTGAPRENVSGEATSVAIYRLDDEGDSTRYRYICSVAEEEYQLEDA